MSHQYEHDDYTHPDVFTVGVIDGWAEKEADPTRINWAVRQARAVIPFQVAGGRPVNPCEKTRVRHGRNEMGFWAENLMADALVTGTHRGRRCLLMIERRDGYGWAVPGGHVEPAESPLYAALRELREETRLVTVDLGQMALRFGRDPEESELRDAGFPIRKLAPRYVPDPRNSDEAWAVTVPVHYDLGSLGRGRLPRVKGKSDAYRAAWVIADTYEDLAGELASRFRGQVFAAHVPMLTEFLSA